MSILMNPVLPVPGPEMSVKKAGGARDFESSFARHLDRQLDEKYGGNSDKLGVAQNNEKSQESLKAKDNSAQETKSKYDERGSEDAKANSVAELLSQFLAELQEVAEQKPGVPGEWKAELPDLELLQQLAADAGMKEAEFSQFMQQLENQDNKIGLVDFFEALNSYFQELDESAPITVPEAELPLLEALLAKMGIDEESIAQLADKAVTGDGKLDLTLLVKGLAGATEGEEGLVPVTLTGWEAEQLQNLLAEAGLTLEAQNELLPERFLNQVLGKENAGEQVQLSVERLQTILKDTIAGVRDSQPKVDLPAFLSDLQQIVAQSDFETQGVGFTPVVEESVSAVFQKLQELVDLARVKVEGNKLQENQLMEEQDVNDDFAKWVKDLEKKFDQSTAQDEAADFSGGTAAGQSGEEVTAAKSESASQPATTFTVSSGDQNVAPTPEAAKGEAAARIPPRQLQQQVFQQLSDGVVRGLKNQEHHLVLRLFPQDLGEVKVNLTVRDEHISVSFNMENARVKEMLESNMEEFKQSMNQRGFSLGECSVSVGQQDSGERWQRFEMARQTVKAVRETMADLPADALYLQAVPTGMDGRQNGVNLIV